MIPILTKMVSRTRAIPADEQISAFCIYPQDNNAKPKIDLHGRQKQVTYLQSVYESTNRTPPAKNSYMD